MATKVSFEGKRELRWMELGSCLVTFMEADIDFSDKLWDDWMEALQRPAITSLMLCSWGPTQPSHQQWRRATRLMRDRKLPVAVVTDARHNLALAKAASWLGTDVQSFRWHQLNDGCDVVGIAKPDRVAAKATIIALRDRFGPVTSDAETGLSSTFRSDRDYSGSYTSATNNALDVSSEMVLEANNEIQAKLAEIQARLRNRERVTPMVRVPTPGSRD